MLDLIGISKSYSTVQANADITLHLKAGQIHALVGENGAGKSTLMKILFGLVQPDAGEIRVKGVQVTLPSPQRAKRLGIAMVQQHFALFDSMTALENIALGLSPAPTNLRPKIIEVSAAYGLEVDPDALVLNLSAGQKQRIEIVRALLGDPQILILDEPTSVLTPQEAKALFAALRALAAEGRGLIFISHKLGEVKALCQAATVLRRGRVVATCDPRTTPADTLAEWMIGNRVIHPQRTTKVQGPVVLHLQDVRTPAGLQIDDLSVRGGEIVGIAGIAGNGQDRLFALLSGEQRTALVQGCMTLHDRPLAPLSPNQRRARGAHFIPEERLGHAAIPDLPLAQSTLLTRHDQRSARNRLGRRRAWIQELTRDIVKSFDVRGGSRHAQARSFSGGNLQKYVVGRELGHCLADPSKGTAQRREPGRRLDFLLINQPTWGVDLWAASRIRQEILAAADQGVALLLISQDLDELLALSDRLGVLTNGHLHTLKATSTWTSADLGKAMAQAPQQTAQQTS